MATIGYMFVILALISIGDLLREVEATPLKRIADLHEELYDPRIPFGDEPGLPRFPIGPSLSLRPIGGEPDFSGLHEALLLEPQDLGDLGFGGSLPVANKGSAVSTSAVGTKSDKGDGGVVEIFVTLTASTIAALTKSLFHWFGGKKSFDFLDTTCHQKTYPYINRLQLRYKSEFECNGYPVTGYGRSANRRKATDEATEDFLNKSNEKKLFKKSVVDQWLKSNAVPTPAPKPTPVTQKPKGFGEICG